MANRYRAGLVAVALVVGCGAQVRFHPAWPDLPFELGDDADRDQAIDQLWVMAPGAARDRAREPIAKAIAHRIRDAIDDEQPFVAATLLDQLIGIWQDDPSAVGRGLAGHVPLLHRLRAVFAKSGALEPMVQILILLAEAEPASRAAYLAELDEVLGFADDLAMAEL
ncbi:MAG TPA: hypothetical protein VHN14_25590, partial [Kofleriaceae bacterium]|nr:hypothetical protein [Kofleriaceae bacterium]